MNGRRPRGAGRWREVHPLGRRVGATVEDVLRMARQYSNWGRWGADDQLGTLNFITPEKVRDAARLVRQGKVFSLAIPFDDKGPQTGGLGRFNPIHVMLRDGNDAITGTVVRDFYGGRDRHLRGTDDLIIMPLQCATQWDALSHIVHEGKMYNGYDATLVSSKGALRNDIAQAREKVVSRGVLLDVARYKGKPWLEPGVAIGPKSWRRAHARRASRWSLETSCWFARGRWPR